MCAIGLAGWASAGSGESDGDGRTQAEAGVASRAAPAAPSSRPADESVEDEVLGNIKRQPVGTGTLEDFDLPDEFLRRVADRVIRASYEQRYRIVVRDAPASALASGPAANDAPPHIPLNPAQPSSAPAGMDGPAPANWHVHRRDAADASTGAAATGARRHWSESRPALRGFRAAILHDAERTWPSELPDSDAPPALRRAATVVSRRLARDGLIPTLALVLPLLGLDDFVRADERHLATLRAVGLPVDLLTYVHLPQGASDPASIVRFVARRLRTSSNPEELRAELAAITFDFVPSHAAFRVAAESGEQDFGALRLQLTRGDYWSGPGDGSSVDVARQLIAALPDAGFIISIEDQHLDALLHLARTWSGGRSPSVTVIPERFTIAQWAQDNGKPGLIEPPVADNSQPVMLAPRYASRGEDGSTFVPGESLLAEGLHAGALAVVQSPLLFQGGNLLAVRDPRTDQRILLMGEAEVYRNTALGLTRDQVLDAFRKEFAVDRCVVLPAASNHIDYELCVRACDGRLVAFVNDTSAAVRLILRCGVDALADREFLTAQAAATARAHLDAGRPREFLDVVVPALFARLDAGGHFPESLTAGFSTSPADSGVGNFQRFLLALDITVSATLQPEEAAPDRHAQAYLRSFRRQEADRTAIRRQLTELGWRVVGVPSLAEADRSINYLNGLHDKTRYLMPAYGGLFAPLDRAAARVFRQELGPHVAVVPIVCAETQRRDGAVHCAASAFARP